MSSRRQTARPHVTGELPGPRSVQLLTRQEQRSIRLVPQPRTRPLVPVSELVLIDQNEAQGWRVRQDQRLDHLFEERCDWVRKYGRAGQLAVDSDESSLTYDELDARANRLARYLRLHGAGAGDRIALLFDVPADSYIAMLAVLKIGAAYVPLDVSFPADRMAYIVEDARVRTVLSISRMADRVEQIEPLTAGTAELVCLDRVAPLIDEQDSRRLIDAERGILDNQLAYIIYTGSNGRPKGVAVDHPSICNFVKVAAEVYSIRPQDRVYQGLTIAFDFSVEEIWVPWVCGATLVPKPSGSNLLGQHLHQFLSERRVTAMCCVPALLAGIKDDLPELRFLLVFGEACPQDLIARWYLPGRRFLNVYGPTEATVTATWTELHPDKPVTAGIPLPTYSTVILDVEDPYRALPHGEIGEIGIAGIGLACGYLNRDDLTEKAFIPDFLDIPANPSGRIYRTGDLGRVTPDGEIEYYGRIDPQSQMRGYRTELTQIESVLQVPETALDTSDPAESPTAQGDCADPPTDTERNLAEVLAEIVGVEQVPVDSNFFDDLGADSMVMARFCARVRKRSDLPSVSMKDVYQHPTIRSLAAAFAEPGPTPVERILAEVLAEIMGLEQVPVDSNFFDDLGADSMVMARFCARVRKRSDLPSVSMKDVYQHPTIRSLAAAFAEPAPTPVESPVPPSIETTRPVGTLQYALCGALQFLVFLAYAYLVAIVVEAGYMWISDGPGLIDIYLRSVLFGSAIFLGLCTLPIAAKWILIGRWKPQQIRVWSLAYVRFWIVKTLVQKNPLMLFFIGSPLYLLYLRALGAKVGRGVMILSKHVPVCTDLLTIGDGTVIRKDSFFTCYRAHAGLIQTGPVTLGRDVFVGEAAVIDIATSLGDGAQLGHTSSLHAGQAVPDGERWNGSPAQRAEVDYLTIEPAGCGTVRRAAYSVLQLLKVLAVYLPLAIGGLALLFDAFPRLNAMLGPGEAELATWSFYGDALAFSLVLFFGAVLVALLVAFTIPRVLNLGIKPDKVYPLFGFHYGIHRTIARTTNLKFLTILFGDSSYIVHYLRRLGYRLSPVVQTGVNFGKDVKHENPYLISIGRGTVCADGISFVNADFSSTSFRVSRVSIGANSFTGNLITYPSQSKMGDNCLLATKVMVPIDGEVRENVGLLGSPSFEIPRTVARDSRFDHLWSDPDELHRRLAAKNRHNLVSMGFHLLAKWFLAFVITLIGFFATAVYDSFGASVIGLFSVLTLLVSVLYSVLIERAARRFQELQPTYCSVYDIDFWRVERFLKNSASAHMVLNGTPFKNVIWRMLGVRLGRRLFDDGCGLAEKNMVTIGDDVTLNAGSNIQCHSMEDYVYKSERITIGSGCTIGVGALVHYGVTMGEGAVLAPDSFLMKGEELPPHERWGGNPAREMPEDMIDLRVRGTAATPALRRPVADSSLATSPVATASGGKI